MMAKETTKTSRWRKMLLVVSLGLNLAVIGLVIGVALNGGPRNGPPRFDLTVGPLTRAMDTERRAAVRDALRDSGAFGRTNRADMRADLDAILDTLRAEQFNQSAFRTALSRQRARLQAGQEAVLDAVAVQIDAMSAQERAAFADRLDEQLRRSTSPRERSGN